MTHKMNILPFLLLISISLLACIIAFASLDGKISGINVMQNFAWNLPVCLLIGFINYKIIVYSHKWHTSFSVWKVLGDMLFSNVLVGCLSAGRGSATFTAAYTFFVLQQRHHAHS